MKTQDVLDALKIRTSYRNPTQNTQAPSISLDDLLDDYRDLNNLSGASYDFLMMAFRYEYFFKIFLNDFTKGKPVSPPAMEDFLLISFASLLTRTAEPLEKQSNTFLEILKSKWGLGPLKFANAFLRQVSRSMDKLKATIANNPELFLPVELQKRWATSPQLCKRMGRQISERPSPFISGFDIKGNFKSLKSSEALTLWQNKSDFFQAMDLGSQLFVRELFSKIKFSETVNPFVISDFCSAPGGKALLLGSLFLEQNKSTPLQVLAYDSKWNRLERLKQNLNNFCGFLSPENLSRFKFSCQLNDARENIDLRNTHLALFDLPCSGSGTLHSRPDILGQSLNNQDRSQVLGLQAAILERLQRSLETTPEFKGVIAISLCSLDPEEIAGVDSFVKKILLRGFRLNEFNTFESTQETCEGIRAWILLPS